MGGVQPVGPCWSTPTPSHPPRSPSSRVAVPSPPPPRTTPTPRPQVSGLPSLPPLLASTRGPGSYGHGRQTAREKGPRPCSGTTGVRVPDTVPEVVSWTSTGELEGLGTRQGRPRTTGLTGLLRGSSDVVSGVGSRLGVRPGPVLPEVTAGQEGPPSLQVDGVGVGQWGLTPGPRQSGP